MTLTQNASTVKAPITAFVNLDLQEMEQLVQVEYNKNGEIKLLVLKQLTFFSLSRANHSISQAINHLISKLIN